MKPQQAFVGLSFLALGLLSAIAYVQRPGRIVSVPEIAIPLLSSNHPSSTATPAVTAPTPVQAPPFSWRQLESEDYPKYIANLRAFGCPEQTLRDIVIADITKLYAAREEPLKLKPSTSTNSPPETPEQRLDRLRQLRTVQQEKRWAIKELLGIDIPLDVLPSSGSRDYHAFEVAFKFLPVDKRDAVQALQETYWQQSDALQTKYEKKKTPESLTESRQLKESLQQELAQVLSPQELEDYEMRTSTTAKQLSDKLSTYFKPSEAEFRQLFRAKRDYEDSLEKLSALAAQPVQPAEGADPKAVAQQRAAQRQMIDQGRTAALTQMNDQLKSTLGEGRYAEYERSQDRTYDLMARLGLRYNLPQETVLQAYDMQKSFNAGPVQTPDGANAQVNAVELQKQLNDRLTAILGEQAARGYRRVNGGSVPLSKP